MSIDTTIEKDPFWTYDLSVLFDKKRLVEFVPTGDMTYEEKLNALMRFFMYATVILLLYTRVWWPIYIPLLGGAFTIFLYKTSSKERKKEQPKPYKQEATYKLEVDTIIPEHCTAPTKENPFMNILFNEWTDNPNRAPACDYKGVGEDIEKAFNFNLYKDVDDIFDKNNSQREFYTTPITTIPNDQTSFAKWLYEVPVTCKEDQNSCLRYEDLRFNRPTFGDSEFLT
jgi:Family of unknown function (DUF5762)